MPAPDTERDPGKIARKWWRGLQPDGPRPGDRAALARLRRADTVTAMAQEATLALFRALGYSSPERLPRVSTLACLLAHVRHDDPGRRFAHAIGRKSFSDEDSAVLKLLRFQRLIEAEGEEEILRAFRRAVDLTGNTANVADLAWVVLLFDREATRRRLTFDYYGASLAAPPDAEATPT